MSTATFVKNRDMELKMRLAVEFHGEHVSFSEKLSLEETLDLAEYMKAKVEAGLLDVVNGINE